MPNGKYGGVSGRKTKVFAKLLRFPTALLSQLVLIGDPFTLVVNDDALRKA